MMTYDFPLAVPGQRIGLLGGSFDPAHQAHLSISREALKRFGLDRIWWLVSPGNPLKKHGPAPLAERIAIARDMIDDPRIIVTDIERHLNTRLTAETIKKLQALYPGVRFTWLMGADNLAQFHLWHGWKDIAARLPIGVLARPNVRMSARLSPAARFMAPSRIPEYQAKKLGSATAPSWVMANVPMLPHSSTAIRQNRIIKPELDKAEGNG